MMTTLGRLAIFALSLLLLQPAWAQSTEEEESLPAVCGDELERVGFRNRYAFVGAVTRMSACNVKGMLPEGVMQAEVSPRARQVIELCYTEEERAFIGNVIKRGVMQSLPHISFERCEEVLKQFAAMPMPE